MTDAQLDFRAQLDGQINPRYVVPGHCTGYSAVFQIAQAMPDALIPNSVGTTLLL